MNRRQLIVGGAFAAAALKAAPARAASDEGGILLGLWQREMGLALAYELQVHHQPAQFGAAGRHARDHAAALATELAAVGHGTPDAPRTPDDLDSVAERLATARSADVLAAAAAAEEAVLGVYQIALPALPDPKIAMTAATILASHAQHLYLFRVT